MQSKHHILIIPSWYPAFPSDINGSFFREQAIALKQRGHKVGVIAPIARSLRDFKGVFNKPYGMISEVDQGINTYRYHTMNFFPRLPNLNKIRWTKIGIRLFENYIKDNGKPDIIHVHSMINAGFLALRLKEKYNIPYVITEHSSVFAKKVVSTSVLNNLKPVVSQAAYLIAVSREFKKLLNSEFKTSSWTYIPNIVNNDFLKTELRDVEKQQFTFISICFLNQNKRVDLLISAFAKMFKNLESVRLKIGGDGSEKDNLIQQAKKLGVDKQIDFLGKLTREQVKHEVSNADVFVLSSEYETFGVVLIESLALGKPIVATKCGGPESIVSPEVGYLVERNSVDSLADAMKNMLDNQSKFKSEDIREYCFQRFSEDVVIQKIETIYTDVLNLKLKNEK